LDFVARVSRMDYDGFDKRFIGFWIGVGQIVLGYCDFDTVW